MRIAFPTEDGVTIHRHFGQASRYAVVTVEGGAARSQVLRSKESHFHGHGHGQNHGHDHGSVHDHRTMFEPVADCQVLIAGHMGNPAYAAAQASGLEVILTDTPTIAGALDAWLAGTLASQLRLVHAPAQHHQGA